jgi:hypothetical protein
MEIFRKKSFGKGKRVATFCFWGEPHFKKNSLSAVSQVFRPISDYLQIQLLIADDCYTLLALL